jgi:chromosome segregation ATPase
MKSKICQCSTPKLGSVGPEQMHVVNEGWRNEYALWHEELKVWQEELKQARENLAKVLESLETHAKKLEKHGASLTIYGQEALEHEHARAEYQRGGSGVKLAALAASHQTDVEHHSHLREIHEQVKRLHHAVVARCSLLLKTCSDDRACSKQTSLQLPIQG